MIRLLVIALVMLPAVPAAAAMLSDDLSPVQSFAVDLDWRYDDGGYRRLDDEQLNAMTGSIRHVEVRLDTSAYAGRNARIYLGLPVIVRGLDGPNAMRLSWTGNGRFNDGTVIPGMRSLIFDGPIQGSVLTDVLNFTLDVDARYWHQQLEFEPYYEIETTSP